MQDAGVAPVVFCLPIGFIDGVFFVTESPASASKTEEASQASSSQASAPPSLQVETAAEDEASQGASSADGRQNKHMYYPPLSLSDSAGVEERLDLAREDLKLYEAITEYKQWEGHWKLEEFQQRSAIKYEYNSNVLFVLFYRVIDPSAEGLATRNFGFRAVSFADVKKLAMRMFDAGGWDGEHHSPLIVWRDQDK